MISTYSVRLMAIVYIFLQGTSRLALGFFNTIILISALMLCACASTSERPDRSETGRYPRTVVDTQASQDGTTIRVVTTNNIVADWVNTIGGTRVAVNSIVPAGIDPHSYSPTTGDVAKLAEADLIFRIGLGMEQSWIHDLMENVPKNYLAVVDLGVVVEPITFSELAESSGHEKNEHDDKDGDKDSGKDKHAHANGQYDPHFWLDPLRVVNAGTEIAKQLSSLDGQGSKGYSENLDSFSARLNELHYWINDQVSLLPVERRVLVSSHHSLQYFASRYGFKVIATLFPGLGTEIDPSPEHLVSVIEKVEKYKVPAVFGEVGVGDRIASAVARETGTKFVRLYSGSLDKNGMPAGTYRGMIKENVKRIVGSLGD